MLSVAGVARHDLAPGAAHTFSPINLQRHAQNPRTLIPLFFSSSNEHECTSLGRSWEATGSSPTKRPTVRDGRAKAAQVPLARRQASERARKRLRPCTRATASACRAPPRPTARVLVSFPAGGLPNIQRSSRRERHQTNAVLCCPRSTSDRWPRSRMSEPTPSTRHRRPNSCPASPTRRVHAHRPCARHTRASESCVPCVAACPRSSPPCE